MISLHHYTALLEYIAFVLAKASISSRQLLLQTQKKKVQKRINYMLLKNKHPLFTQSRMEGKTDVTSRSKAM